MTDIIENKETLEEIQTSIETDLEKVDEKESAVEILQWLIENVEQYIDNQRKIFKIDLILDEKFESMPNTKLMQDLYRSIADLDPEVDISELCDWEQKITDEQRETIKYSQKFREILNEKVKNIFESMKNENEKLDELFKRMIFYYELKGFNKGEFIIEPMEGEVSIINFEYEAFPVNVEIKSPEQNENGDKTQDKAISKQYTIPEGFTVWIEIAYATKRSKMSSLF